MDRKSLDTIELPKVLAKAAAFTSFSAGRERTLQLQPVADRSEVERRQAEVAEAVALFNGDSDVIIGAAHDVRPAAAHALRGFTLSSDDFLNIKSTLIAARNLRRGLQKHAERRPNLADLAALIDECPGLVSQITLTLDERGEVLDSASDQLARLRRQIQSAYNRIQDRLQSLIGGSSSQYLQEPLITMRSGRYVVPLRMEFKGRIKGIVHDHSGSGATLWIEPLNTVELNNEYRQLQIEEEQEIERILAALSGRVAVQGEEVKSVVELMAELDCIFARARFAMNSDAVRPQFVDWRRLQPPHPGSTIWVRGARHPLLEPLSVIPTDFMLDEETFTVLITGPNTGGKTVALKNIALIVAMAQAGLHVPAAEARLTVFDNIFADIGDEQSIEQSLSTFSAHITNIIRVLDHVDDRSLVVLDELGSGTDPTEGAAIAQAIINFLRDKGATSFIATHYPELKLYASQTAGATNASMLFNVETLSPTYEMAIGIPGKSNALAIARRLGLDETILDDAMNLVGVGNRESESLIDSIFDLREKISSEEAATRLALRQAEQERDRLRIEGAAIEYERRRILSEARDQAEEELEQIRNELRRARKRLRDAESQTQVKKISRDLSEVEAGKLQTFEDEEGEGSTPKRRRFKRLQVGDRVLVRQLNTSGIIQAIQSGDAEVAVGRMTMRVNLDALEFRGRDEEPEEPAPTYAASAAPITAPLELDIRGERVESGLEQLDQYLDNASLADMPWVRIIHGKGTGRLREAVRKALGQHSAVARWEPGREGEGGSGVTVAHFIS